MDKPSLSIQAGSETLTRGNARWNKTELTFSFPTTTPAGSEGPGFSAFSAQQQAATVQIFRQVSELTNLRITAHVGNAATADIRLFNIVEPGNGIAGDAELPSGDTPSNLRINLDSSGGRPVRGDDDFLTLVHEIGHSLGLQHPGNYDGGNPTYPVDAQFREDTEQFTVMSYFSSTNTGADWAVPGPGTVIKPQTFQIFDILALQRIYGANTTTRAGDTVYGFNSTAGEDYTITSANNRAVFTIWDGGGTDTLDLSGYSQNQVIDLRDGGFTNAGGLVANIAIAIGARVENARGGGGADQFFGNALNNNIRAGAGNDTIRLTGGGDDVVDGGAGFDSLIFDGPRTSFTITPSTNPAGGTLALVSEAGQAADRLTNVEVLQFTDRNVFVMTATEGQVGRLYKAAFGRDPDLGGLAFWIGVREGGTPLADIGRSFIDSAEFTTTYGALNNQGFVQALYRNVLGRDGEAGGIEFWRGTLDSGQARQTVLLGFSDSAENVSGTAGLFLIA